MKKDDQVQVPDAVKAAAARAQAAFEAQDGQPTPTPEPVVTSGGNDPPPPVPVPDPEGWEHKFKSMKGRYEVADQTLRQQGQQISNLQNLLATVKASTPPPSPSPVPVELQAHRLITDQEETEYGADFLKVVGKKSQEEFIPVVNALKAEIAELRGRVTNVGTHVAMDAQERLDAVLNDQCPEWRTINEDQKFLSWLRLPDVYSGAIRHDLLKAAYERKDAPRVLAFFNGFLTEEAAVAPGPDPKAAPAGKIPLEKFAAPGRAKTAATSAPAEKPIITTQQISQFYNDVTAGKYRGRDEERKTLEKSIFLAQSEGRVR